MIVIDFIVFLWLSTFDVFFTEKAGRPVPYCATEYPWAIKVLEMS